MGFTTPKTWTAAVLTASDMNTYVRDNQNQFVRVIDTDIGPVGNVGAGEDDLITLTSPANTLIADGDVLRWTSFGTTAANGNTKTIKVYFDATQLVSASSTYNDQPWRAVAWFQRVGSSSISYYVELIVGTSIIDVDGGALGVTATNSRTLKCTGESGSSANDDVVQRASALEYVPAVA